jgi:alpha-ketoglutarate-dependent taurine dioxygenase
MALELEQLTPVIGSEIRGIDLNQVDAATAARIKTALNERLVLVFRDQSLTHEAHKRFARFFGTGQLQRHLPTANTHTPPARAIRPARAHRTAGRVPSHSPSNGAKRRYAICFPCWQLIRMLKVHDRSRRCESDSMTDTTEQ